MIKANCTGFSPTTTCFYSLYQKPNMTSQLRNGTDVCRSHFFFSPITSLLLWSAASADLLKKNKNRWALLIWHLFPCLGVTPPALALWDINGDSMEDVFLGVTELTNDTHPSQGNKSTWGAVHKGRETFVSWIYFNIVVLSVLCNGLYLLIKPSLQCGGPVGTSWSAPVEERHAGVCDVHPVWPAVPADPRSPPHQ